MPYNSSRKLIKKELIKYLPTDTPINIINKFKKTSKVILYEFDGTHGIYLEIKTYKSKLGTIDKVYKIKCGCCSKSKQTLLS